VDFKSKNIDIITGDQSRDGEEVTPLQFF